MSTDRPAADGPDHSSETIEAMHEVELALEALQRAQGHLIEFHHAVGHGMDHLDRAEPLLRQCEHHGFADELRDEYLPRGVVDGHRWSYEVLEGYQDGFLADLQRFECRVREALADGTRHVAERRQEHEWKHRATGEWSQSSTDDERSLTPDE